MPSKRRGYYIINSKFTPKAIYQDVDEVLQIFKIDFLDNIDYLLQYTKLSKSSYLKEMSRYGIPSFQKKMTDLRNGKKYGLELYYIAATAKIFGLPVKLILNYNLKIKQIDLTKYGLYPDCYRTKKRSSWDGTKTSTELTEPHPRSLTKKKERLIEKAKEKSNNPQPTYNFWQEWNRTTVTDIS